MRTFSSAMIVCLVAISVSAQAPTAAVISAGPHTTVNGTKVLDRMTVFPGDKVETHEQQPADLILKGTTLRVLGKSEIEFHDSWAELRSGGAMVTTTSAFQLKSKCFSAEPIFTSNTRYSVVVEAGRILVRGEEGEVVLRTKKELRISAGKTAAISFCGMPGEKSSLIDGKGNLKYFLAGAGAGGAAAAIVPLMSGGCKAKVSAGAPDDCQN